MPGDRVDAILAIKDRMSQPIGVIGRNFRRLQDLGTKALRSIGNSAKRLVTGPLGKLFAILSGAAIVAGLDRTRKSLDEIAKTAARINISTEALSELAFAGELTGVNINTLSLALQRMTRRISQAAQGTGEAQKALAELGLSAEQLNALSADQQFYRIARAIQNVKNPADQLRLAFQLFDSEGTKVLNTLRLGEEGLRKAAREARRFNLVFTKEELQKVENFNDAIFRLQSSFAGAFRRLLVDLAPFLTTIVDNLTKLVNEELLGNLQAISKGILSFIQSMTRFAIFMIEVFQKLISLMGELAGAIGSLIDELSKIRVEWLGIDLSGLSSAGDALRSMQEAMQDVSQDDSFVSYLQTVVQWLDLLKDGIDEAARIARERRLAGDQPGSGRTPMRLKPRESQPFLPQLPDPGALIQSGIAKVGDAFEAIGNAGKRGIAILVELEKQALESFNAVNAVVLRVADTIEGVMGRAIDRVIDGTFNLKEAMQDLGREILRTLSKLAINRAVSSIFGGGPSQPGLLQGFISSIFPGSNPTGQPVVGASSAMGNAFVGGRVVQSFAKGGILNSRVLFPLGEAGEAGPEAVMPLGRTRSGRLGVELAGGAATVINNYNIYANDAQSFARMMGTPEGQRVIRASVQNTRETRTRRT